MRLEDWWDDWRLADLLESYLPDFVLGFAFFTSIMYAVLGKRFEKQRPAITMSAAIGFALSLGLVWWEQANGFSIKNLGPIAIGFAILVLAFVMYQSIRQIGGSWAGAGITLGATIVIAQLLHLNVPIAREIIQSITVVALVIGMMAFLKHCPNRQPSFSRTVPSIPDARHDMADLYRERQLSRALTRRMRRLRRESKELHEHPQEAEDVLLQLRRMMPAEGYLTERLAQLRAKAHQIRKGHVARLEETKQVFADLPASARKEASAQLAAKYNQVVGIDTRLERLDRAVAETERRIRQLTAQAQEYAAGHNFPKLCDALKAATRLQRHNSTLFRIIDRTEHKLSSVAAGIAKEVKQVGNAK
jgi:hypothetical protein